MTGFPKVLGLIPARMGSKGIPGKNMKVLDGKPLIQYTIESAQQSALLHSTIVSTDCLRICHFAHRFEGICVPFLRPGNLATDASPMIDVVRHAINFYGTKELRFDYLLLLQPTSPFREPELIDQAIRQIISNNADSLVTIRTIPTRFNHHWAYLQEDVFLGQIVPESNVSRRQDLPPTYCRDGRIYISRISLIEEGLITGGKISGLLNENEFDVNLDTNSDWIQAESLIKKWKHR